MKLSPARFNAHLRHMGQNALWRRAHACPCRDAYSGAARPGCPQCAGKGWIWDAPIATHLALSGAKRQQQWAQMGMYEAGDVVISLPSDEPVYALGQTDRIVLIDSTEVFSTTFVRGQDDAAWPFPVARLDRVFYLDATNHIVECALPALYPDHYTALWPASPAPTPPAGQRYTVTGMKHPEYFCWNDEPQDRHHHDGLDLPRHVVLRRFDLFGR